MIQGYSSCSGGIFCNKIEAMSKQCTFMDLCACKNEVYICDQLFPRDAPVAKRRSVNVETIFFSINKHLSQIFSKHIYKSRKIGVKFDVTPHIHLMVIFRSTYDARPKGDIFHPRKFFDEMQVKTSSEQTPISKTPESKTPTGV